MPDMTRSEFIALVGGSGLLLATKVRRARAAAGDAGGGVSPQHDARRCGTLVDRVPRGASRKQALSLARTSRSEYRWRESKMIDPPPLKWSDLRYVFDIKEDCNGKEAIQA